MIPRAAEPGAELTATIVSSVGYMGLSERFEGRFGLGFFGAEFGGYFAGGGDGLGLLYCFLLADVFADDL